MQLSLAQHGGDAREAQNDGPAHCHVVFKHLVGGSRATPPLPWMARGNLDRPGQLDSWLLLSDGGMRQCTGARQGRQTTHPSRSVSLAREGEEITSGVSGAGDQYSVCTWTECGRRSRTQHSVKSGYRPPGQLGASASMCRLTGAPEPATRGVVR